MARTIILSLASPSSVNFGRSEYWSVTEDGRICDGLCWDEMLGVIARITIDDVRRGPFLTVEEHKDAAEKKALRNATPSRLEDALRQLVDALKGKENAGPIPDAVTEAVAAIAAVEAERGDDTPF